MSDTQGAAPPADAGPGMSTETVPTEGTGNLSARDAARALSGYREKRDEGAPREAAPVERPIRQPNEPPAIEPTDEGSEDPGTAPLEAPRSWSKEWKEEFATYPRAAQEKILAREQERDTAVRRGQNEIAEQRKALEVERFQSNTVRQRYEAALPAIMQQLQEYNAGQFGDIRTQSDVDKLAREDPLRYTQWDAHQRKMANIRGQQQYAQQRQYQEYQSQWGNFAKEQDSKLMEQAPELADRATADKVAQGAVSLLNDLGFSQGDLDKLWSGQASVSLRDHRIQLLIRDALRYREAKSAVPKARVAPVAPKVQRPGSPVERVRDSDSTLKALDNRLESTGKWKDAAALLIARRNRG